MELNSPVSDLPLVGPSYETKLSKLNITTIKDLLLHIPHRYLDFTNSVKISQVQIGETVTLKGKIKYLKNQYTKSGRNIQIGELYDDTGTITLICFSQCLPQQDYC